MVSTGTWSDTKNLTRQGPLIIFAFNHSTGVTCHVQGTVGTSGAMKLDNYIIAPVETVRVLSFKLTYTYWSDVTTPVGWTWSLPFTIQKNGRSFRTDLS